MSDREIQSITSRCPGIHTEQGRRVASEAVAFFCGDGLALRKDQMRRLILRDPRVLELSADAALRPQASRWLEKANIGLTRGNLRDILRSCPEVFLLDYDSTLAPIMTWLLVDVQLPRDRVKNMLLSCPGVLAANLDTELRPRLRWLSEELRLDVKGARRILTLSPEVLDASLEEILLPACDWLRRTAGCDMTGVGQLLAKAPALAVTEVDVLEASMSEMTSVLFEEGTEDAATILTEQPWLLLQSDRLAALTGFMTRELGATLAQAREVLANDPAVLEFQIERRVLPRLKAIRDSGMGAVDRRSGDGDGEDARAHQFLSLRDKMKILGKFSDARFGKWVRMGSVRTTPRNDVGF